MKVLTSKIVNGKKMFLIEDNNPQGKVFAQDGKPIKKENISNYNPYYVDVKGLNASESTKTSLTPATKITPQEIKKIKESPTNVGNIKIKEAQEKAQRLKEAEEAYKKRKAGVSITPELLAQETQAIGDKISLQNIPGVGQYIPDVLDITGGLGSMASNLGALPLNLKRGNYGQAALSIATPLTMGALGSIGAKTTGQFVNNLANPFAGTGDLINNLGNKYLPNMHKLNPFSFKPNENMLYRGLGKEGIEDALKSKVLRPKQYILPEKETFRDILNRPKDFKTTFYSPNFKTADQYGNGFIAEVSKDAADFAKRYGRKDWSVHTSKQIPISEVNLLEKDWLKGYKEIPKPQQSFKSEIDWAKWNKEIPENKALMQEYNTIEQQTKANGTWMKNSDGSAFQGTPEQFVQQNSQNFKKAFGNSKLINSNGTVEPVVHSTNAKFSTFDKSYFGKTDEGYHGEGFYLSPIQRTGFDGEFYQRPYKWIDNKTVQGTHNYGKNKMMLYANPDKIVGDFPVKPFTEIIVNLDKPYNIKSAIGNNGMFDMTNPNIYKSIVGALATGTLGKQAMQKKEFGGKILDTRIVNGQKQYLINE